VRKKIKASDRRRIEDDRRIGERGREREREK
jgi:hypothetical protein